VQVWQLRYTYGHATSLFGVQQSLGVTLGYKAVPAKQGQLS